MWYERRRVKFLFPKAGWLVGGICAFPHIGKLQYIKSEISHKPIENEDAVRNHDHYTGQILGWAHNKCNLLYKNRTLNKEDRIPVMFHNYTGYDGHFLVRALEGESDVQIGIISKSFEKYITLTVDNLQFIDSLNFLSGSLEAIARSYGEFPHLDRQFPNCMDLRQKGVYPYEFVTSLQVLEETTSLPSRDSFYSNLVETGVSQEDYERAQRIWSRFQCQTLKDYTLVYLCTDVLLLTDVFEAFRAMALEHYELDPAHYLTLPAFSWDALLKTTKVELQLLTDPDMHMFVESGVRGGYSGIHCRHAHSTIHQAF